MPLEIVTLSAEHLPALVRFARRVWKRPEDAAYLRWRYLEAPAETTYLLLGAGECLATLTVFARRYRLGSDERLCHETADWHCLPELRGSGVGIRLMKRVMELGRPIVAVGGSADTRTLLPRLGWTRVGAARRFVRPLRLESFTRVLRSKLSKEAPPDADPIAPRGSAGGWLDRWLLLPRASRGVRTVQGARLEPALTAVYERRCSGCETVPLPAEGQLEWLARSASEVRRYVWLTFTSEESPAGWALLRLDGPSGAVEATLLELFSPEPPLYDALVAEILRAASALGARQISARTSCPATATALGRHHFWGRDEQPIHCWQAGDRLPAPLHLGWNVGDAALMPYPTAWSPAAAVPS